MSDSSTTSSLQSTSSSLAPREDRDEFYIRFYQAHRCRVGSGYEFLEFELLPNGKLRHANNANYHRHEGPMIRQEVFLSPGVVDEFRRMICSSNIAKVDDTNWTLPQDNADLQEIECKMGNMHISFRSTDLTTVAHIEQSADPEGLKTFYFLAQDLKAFFHTLISAHFKARPFG